MASPAHTRYARFSKKRKSWLSLLLLCLLVLTTGCSTSSGEKQIFPLCMSLDRLPDGRLQLAVQVSGMAADQSGDTALFIAAGDSFEQALEILGASMPYPLHFGQLRLCLISSHLAEQEELSSLLAPLIRLSTINPHAAVMVCMGNAAQTMAAQQPDLGVRLSTYLDQLFARLRQERLTPPETLYDIVGMLSTGYRDPLLGVCALNSADAPSSQPSQGETGGEKGTQPVFASGSSIAIGEPPPAWPLPDDLTAGAMPRKGGNPVEYIGCAMVGRGRVTGYLTAPETRQALTLRQEARVSHVTESGAMVTIQNPEKITLEDACAIANKWQAAHCDAIGVIASAAREATSNHKLRSLLHKIDASSIVLSMTYRTRNFNTQ